MRADLLIVVQYKLRDVNLVGVNGIKKKLDPSQVVYFLLHLITCECQEPPGLQLGRGVGLV